MLMRRVGIWLLAAIVTALPTALDAQGVIDESAVLLPPDFQGADIDSLINKARYARRGPYETTSAYLSRIGVGSSEPLRLARLVSVESVCGPMTSYDADSGMLTVAIPHIAGIIVLRCGGKSKGVSSQGEDLDAIARIPIAPDTAERTRSQLQYWLAFRRAPTAERGTILRPFPTDSSMEGLVSKDVALWVTNADGDVVFKKTFVPFRSEQFVRIGELPNIWEPLSGTSPPAILSSPPTQTIAQACASSDRFAAVLALLDERDLYDRRMQLMGLQMNGYEVGTTWEQYLARSIEQQCNPSGPDTIPFKMPPDSVTLNLGDFGCWSKGPRCVDRRMFVAPMGYQVCTVRFRVYKRGRPQWTLLSVKPDSFAVGVPDPAPFRAVQFLSDVDGQESHKHHAEANDIRIQIIFAHFDLAERRLRGCDLPDRGTEWVTQPATPAPTTPNAPATPARITGMLYCDPVTQRRGASLTFRNTGGSVGIVEYVISYRESSGAWKAGGYGRQSISPGGSISLPYHSWYAVGWQAQWTDGGSANC